MQLLNLPDLGAGAGAEQVSYLSDLGRWRAGWVPYLPDLWRRGANAGAVTGVGWVPYVLDHRRFGRRVGTGAG